MKNVFDDELELMPANELKEITITEEDVYKNAREQTLASIMNSMQQFALKGGKTQYKAQFSKKHQERMANDVMKTFEGLGYKVIKDESVLGTEEMVNITLDWSLA